MQSLHPRDPDFLAALSAQVPESLASFLYGLSAASCVMWDQGGLMVQRVMPGPDPAWVPGPASPHAELLEFFACVCGNRSGTSLHWAEPALAAFEHALTRAFPDASFHMQVEQHEPSWCSELHLLVRNATDTPLLYIELFWSVD